MTEHLDGQLRLSIAQKSIAGNKPCNEDCIGIRVPEGNTLTNKGITAVIADGVSAADAGKEASDASVQGFLSDYYSTPDSWQTKTSCHKVITALNRWLYSQGHGYLRSEKGFVCTLSVLILKSRSAFLFHVGDTRIYRIRGNHIEPLTRDHVTTVERGKRYLARAMGMDLNLDVDYKKTELEVNDIYLLTSDGVHDYLTDGRIREIVQTESNLENAAKQLIDQALANDSPDNLSCQLLRVDTLPSDNAEDLYTRLTQLPFAPYLHIGMTLDGLTVEEEIHGSNRSEVYLVRHQETGERYVMKVASQNFDDDPAYIERFVMEEWIGRRINNRHIIKVIYSPEKRSCLYYLTEYLSGGSLKTWMKNNPKPGPQQIYPIVKQLAKAVTALHRLETLHQDIKPENILFNEQGDLKLIDFGSCRVGGVDEINTVLTRDTALGTRHFSAPEYHLNRKPGVQSDLFSVGVICYQMLSGQLPYGEKYASAKNAKDLYQLKYISVCKHNPLVPPWVDGAIKKMVSIQPESRYEELSEFIYDLEHPNPSFSGAEYQPLIEKNPLRFWQAVAGASVLINLGLLYVLLTWAS